MVERRYDNSGVPENSSILAYEPIGKHADDVVISFVGAHGGQLFESTERVSADDDTGFPIVNQFSRQVP